MKTLKTHLMELDSHIHLSSTLSFESVSVYKNKILK